MRLKPLDDEDLFHSLLALGYTSFEEYGEKKRGLSLNYLYKIAKAAEVQLSLSDCTNSTKIPETQLRPLAPLTDEERQQVWNHGSNGVFDLVRIRKKCSFL
ncbi:MAG: hypothetical protein JZU59_13305 [Chromatium okenii]|nr:hypothetical protein [Chromatium okenii]